MDPVAGTIYLGTLGASVVRIAKGSVVQTSVLAYNATAVGAINDVAVTANGAVYIIRSHTEPFPAPNNLSRDYVWRLNAAGTQFILETSTRLMSAITGGWADQAWGVFFNTIFTRVQDGTNIFWLDNEKVNTTFNDCAIIFPVAAGNYTITETIPTGWRLSRVTVYDPSSNSSSSVENETATLNVTAGEVVHVEFANILETATPALSACGSNILQDFGRAAAPPGPINSASPLVGLTNYHFNPGTGNPIDGYYSISRQAQFANAAVDRSGIPGEYFMIINASYSSDEFYRQKITGLTPGNKYTLSFWATDLSPAAPIRPNIRFGVENPETGVELGAINTGGFNHTTWQRYSFTFTAITSDISIFIRNNGAGGNGNDLAIDDIGFELAPPDPVQATSTNANCTNGIGVSNGSITISAPLSTPENPVEYNVNGGPWQTTTIFNNLPPGNYTVNARLVGTNCSSIPINLTVRCPFCGSVADINAGIINTPIAGNISTNDKMAPGTVYQSPGAPANQPTGSNPVLNLNADGSYTFTTDLPGRYIYNVQVCEPPQSTNCPTQQLVITVTDPYQVNPPIANNETAMTPYNTAISSYPVLANDAPGNVGGTLTPASVVIMAAPANGVAVANPDGTITYTPNNGFAGRDVVEYQVCEAPSGQCATAKLEVIVLGPFNLNEPFATDDYSKTPMNSPTAGNVVTNDKDPGGNALTVAPQNITNVGGIASLILNADGSYNFIPTNGFTGTVNVPYTVCDNGTPQACANATLYIQVNPPTYSISGLVRQDSNGLMDNEINGTPTNVGGLFALALNDNGTVIASAPVIADGTYTINNLVNGDYTIKLSAINVAPGQQNPATNLPAGWVNVGELLGTGVGSDNNADGNLTAIINGADLSNANFGIQRAPITTSKTDILAAYLAVGQDYKLDNQPLSGSDPEDSPAANSIGAGGRFEIVTLPPSTQAALYYNGVEITSNNFIIENYEPTALSIRFMDVDLTSVSFTYSALDASGSRSITPASYTVTIGPNLLSGGAIQLKGRVVNNNVQLKWTTTGLDQVAQYRVEWLGVNGRFMPMQVITPNLANRNNAETQFGWPSQSSRYATFRVWAIMADGSSKVSNQLVLSNQAKAAVEVFPNPATQLVNIALANAGTYSIVFTDASGRQVKSFKEIVPTGGEVFTTSTTSFASGLYYIKIVSENNAMSTVKKLVIDK